MTVRKHRAPRVLAVASVSALGAICLMVWSLVDPRPIPVVFAMSAGQALGTLSLLGFLMVVVADMRRRLGDKQPPSARPSGPSGTGDASV